MVWEIRRGSATVNSAAWCIPLTESKHICNAVSNSSWYKCGHMSLFLSSPQWSTSQIS
jgi:hypothetical protein